MNQEKIAQLIKTIRKEHHLTQTELAKQLGVTYQAVSKWETGKNIPDIAIIQKICQDYELDIQQILVGVPMVKKNSLKKRVLLSLTSLVFLIIVIGVVYHIKNQDSTFEFKTLTAMCDEFTITGSAAYDRNKTSIYISNIDYCGKEDYTLYEKIECNLYESNQNTEIKIATCNYDQQNVTLKDYFKQVTFYIDDYVAQCREFKDANMYLLIHAYQEGKATTYKVPLAFNDHCSN